MHSRLDERRRSRSRSRDRDNSGTGLPGGMPPTMNAMQSGAMGALPTFSAAPTAIVPSALTSILAAQQAAQNKVNRELFVGNTPPGTSEMLLLQFLNGAMRRVKLCPEEASPIVQCRVNAKFAFVECQNQEDANLVLNLNGIPFLGASLKVSRPSKYTGPFFPAKSWQELTGNPLPAGMGGGDLAEDKINRELFIGNTTPEMTEQMLRDFLGKAMAQVGLTDNPGNPITACRVSGKFAFVELRSVKEAASALNLNNIPYMGAMLRVGRPSKYTGIMTEHGNWEDILAKYMTGELILPSLGGAPVNTFAAPAPEPEPVSQTPATRVVELKNMVTAQDLLSDQDYEEILEDTKDECGQFGSLKSVVIPRTGTGATKIFLSYISQQDAAKAIAALLGRTFDGRKVHAAYFSEEKFANEDYSDSER